jgi:hypothetical protein
VPQGPVLAAAIAAVAFLALGMVGASPERPRAFDDVAVVGLAPGPDSNRESIVQLDAARSYEWYARLVSVHTWLAFRRAGEQKYTVYEAHGFSALSFGPIGKGMPEVLSGPEMARSRTGLVVRD